MLEVKRYARKRILCLFGSDRKIRPSGSLFGITWQSLVKPNSDPRDGFFYPHLTPMKDSYNLMCHKTSEPCYKKRGLSDPSNKSARPLSGARDAVLRLRLHLVLYTRLRGCTGLPEPSLIVYVLNTLSTWAGSEVLHIMGTKSYCFITSMWNKVFWTMASPLYSKKKNLLR